LFGGGGGGGGGLSSSKIWPNFFYNLFIQEKKTRGKKNMGRRSKPRYCKTLLFMQATQLKNRNATSFPMVYCRSLLFGVT